MVREDVPQVTHNHTKSSGLYRKIHMKTGTDQGLGCASLQASSMADLFFFLQAPWMLQRMKESGGGRQKEEEKSYKKIKTSKRIDIFMPRIGGPFL